MRVQTATSAFLAAPVLVDSPFLAGLLGGFAWSWNGLVHRVDALWHFCGAKMSL